MYITAVYTLVNGVIYRSKTANIKKNVIFLLHNGIWRYINFIYLFIIIIIILIALGSINPEG